MKTNLLLGLTLLLTVPLLAQTGYFQQAVNYTINATLDDQQHQISGDITIEYTNNSPDELEVIWLHLWPNAFSKRNTAFARQKIRQGSSRFYFADEEDLGSVSNLNFTVDGTAATLEFPQPENPDVARLRLPKPVASGATIRMASPFLVKIPASFSRLGRVGTSYQMTQWYPKPAVYDQDGWHPMPYLDQGEFYSEFGNFDVTLTLPQNYVVGASGTLQTEQELDS